MLTTIQKANSSTLQKTLENSFIVVPLYNESAVIENVLLELREKFRNIIVVDDGSSDNSATISENLGFTTLRHIINRGQGASIQTGIKFALEQNAEYIITFDGDGQHDPKDISLLVQEAINSKVDVLLGSRFLSENPSIPKSRKLLLMIATFFTKLNSGLELTDTHNGLRVFSKAAAEKIQIRLDRMAHASEILDQIGKNKLTYKEHPVSIKYTNYSLNKGQGIWDAYKILKDYFFGKLLP